jgi:heat shock protein HtpX
MSTNTKVSDIGDFRQTIKKNNRRTIFVIFAFVFIYVALGLIIDLFLYFDPTIGDGSFSATVSHFFSNIIYDTPPIATLILALIATVSILIVFAFNDKLMMMGTTSKEISRTQKNLSADEKQLLNIVEELKISAGMNYMPKVYIIEENYMNAFASGYSEKSALVAVTRRLMSALNRDELQAVMAHELTHIRNNDIKLTLFATVLANIMVIVLDIALRGVIYNRKAPPVLKIAVLVLRFVVPILTYFLMMYLSRKREYMADAGAVELMRNNKPMMSALLKISGDYKNNKDELTIPNSDDMRRAAYIFNIDSVKGFKSFLSGLFSTHPKTTDRIKELQGL